MDDVDLYKTPMTAYLAQVDTVTYYMVEVCRTLQQTAEPMKRWVVADSAYARKAQTAIKYVSSTQKDNVIHKRAIGNT